MKLNNKNVFILLTFCFLFLVVAFPFQHGFNVISFRDLATDSGFDSDFGGSDSGWDSGSSSSSSSDFGGSSGGTVSFNLDPVSLVVGLVLAIVVIYPVLSYCVNDKKGAFIKFALLFISIVIGILISGFFSLVNILLFILIWGLINRYSLIISIPLAFLVLALLIGLLVLVRKRIIKKISLYMGNNNSLEISSDKYFSEAMIDPLIVNQAYKIYLQVQQAWSKNNIEEVRSLLSDSLCNTYKAQIETMKVKNQRNEMSDFEFVKGCIHEYKSYGDKDVYVITLQVLCKDYLVDSNTNNVIKGDSNYINNYTYSLTFEKHKDIDIKECPNCSAELPTLGESVKCPYCGSVIERKSTNMVLVDKKMLVQK